jgi:putative Mg2+ transporter-C (MgtC) family protein
MEFISHYLSMVDPLTFVFLKGLGVSIVLGYMMGAEREMRGKDAGISTHIFVITGAMLFTILSMVVDPASKSRIAAQIVSGIGFLGAGLILKDGLGVRNLTTAASLWFSAAVGMTIGYGYYAIAIISGVGAIFIPRIRHFKEEPFVERDKANAQSSKTKKIKA